MLECIAMKLAGFLYPILPAVKLRSAEICDNCSGLDDSRTHGRRLLALPGSSAVSQKECIAKCGKYVEDGVFARQFMLRNAAVYLQRFAASE